MPTLLRIFGILLFSIDNHCFTNPRCKFSRTIRLLKNLPRINLWNFIITSCSCHIAFGTIPRDIYSYGSDSIIRFIITHTNIIYAFNIITAGITSPDTLYDEEVATFDEDDVYDQKDSAGFINLYGLPIKVRAKLNQKRGK